MSNLLVVIGGPTAVGKTSVAIDLAKHFNTEIISADSRQFYKEMTIGTAKPTKQELSEAIHHLVDCKSIHDKYSVGDYEREVIPLLDQLFTKHNIVILVGGSGLFIDLIINGINDLPSTPPEVRERLESLYEKEGIEPIRELLKKQDPDFYNHTDTNNHIRMMRALEAMEVSGKTFSELRSAEFEKRNFDHLMIVVDDDRQQLYDRINNRVDQMLADGLVEEAKSLHSYKSLKSLRTVGYQELFQAFDNEISMEEAIRLIKRNSRRYAKKQISWFKRYKNAHWLKRDEIDKMIELIGAFKS